MSRRIRAHFHRLRAVLAVLTLLAVTASSHAQSITVAPGASPAGGYLPLSLFGIDPIEGMFDDTFANFNVPAFVYAGQSWTNIAVMSNGYVVVGGAEAADSTFVNENLPSVSRPNNVLAPFWTDLDPGISGGIRIGVLTDGVNEWLVVDWENVPRHTLNEADLREYYTFQIWIGLNGTEDISYAYGAIGGDGDHGNSGFGLTTVGAENHTGTIGDTYYYNVAGTLPTNGTQQRVTSENIDVVPPVITLNGDNPMVVGVGSTFVDPGATAVDNVDGSIPVSVSGTVDTSTPGTYTLTYTAEDSSTNVATATRTVIVASLIVEQTAVKRSGKNAQVKITIRNIQTETATNVQLTAATLGGTAPNGSLPISLGSISGGGTATVTLMFKVGAGSQTLLVAGTSSLGAFSLNKVVAVP
jgi:hypothetical protein